MEAGGNCFDTAFACGGGEPEWLLGQWMKNRTGLRDEPVVIAKGAHTPNYHPASRQPRVGNSPTEDEIVRCWHCEDNFQRRERTLLLAKERGVEAINIALASVMAQSFPTFALIGPRTLEEIRTSLPELTVELTPEEVA